MMEYRIGHGYDVHRLVEGRRLILGGVEVPYERGLLGHSDADVLLHALMDALLGAVGEGDIGRHFPDSDPAYEGVSSLHLLTAVRELLDRYQAEIVNVDLTLVLQRPRVASYLPQMRENIAFALRTVCARVNIKATTEEHLGFTGRGEGVAAHAVVMLTASPPAMSDGGTDSI